MSRTESMDRWLKQYAGDHRNPTNHRIHQIFIPIILLSAVGLLQFVPVHRTLFGVALGLGDLALMILLAFYSHHDLKLAFASVPGAIGMALIIRFLSWPVLVALFVIGWVAQLIGHAKYERNKPTLTANLVALLVAPAFLVDELLPHPPKS
jgi:uncharacterized membrane protein YGL010W